MWTFHRESFFVLFYSIGKTDFRILATRQIPLKPSFSREKVCHNFSTQFKIKYQKTEPDLQTFPTESKNCNPLQCNGTSND